MKRKRKMMEQDVSRSCFGETSHSSLEVMKNNPLLEPKHKIFLSHSGAQKEFVEHLCKALEDRCHFPFFDRCHESLSKGEQFPKLIVQATEQCEMLIVVVSNEYFMSEWPMIELNAFVQAHKLRHEQKNSTKGPKIFPLFYGLSVGDLKNARMQNRWFHKWETLAKANPRNRIVVSDWKYAFHVLRSFNGLSYNAKLKDIVAYEEEIVLYVCKSISPNIKWDDSHVQGKSSICKVIGEKIEGIGISRKYNVKVVGLYGVGGIGKTTSCKTLCNDFLSKYEGRVCHIEFPIEFASASSKDFKEFFGKVSRELTRKSVDVIQNLDEGKCKKLLRDNLFKQRTFLAIDNISENHQSILFANTLLQLPYHMDSLVIVTARSPSVFELLGVNGDAYFEMLDLGEEDAMRLFLQHAIGGKEFFEDEEKRDIMTCVRRCYFSKGAGQGHHYHPLALQSLGLQLGCHGEHPLLWLKHLPCVETFNSLFGGNPVFDILRSGYDLLSSKDQTLLMDVRWFLNKIGFNDLLSLLCSVHKEEDLKHRVKLLKQKGLLQDVDLKSGKVTMHDLYSEFIELEVKGSFNDSTDLTKRKWVHIEDGDLAELKFIPNGGCWQYLSRLSVVHRECFWKNNWGIGGKIGSLEGIKWKHFANVEVLHLRWVHLEHIALNLEGLVCLRILEVCISGVINGMEGLGKLENLTHFSWNCAHNVIPMPLVGQLPLSLKVLEISGWIVLVPDALARCKSLVNLCFEWAEAISLDLSQCRFLESVYFGRMKKLETVLGPSDHVSSSLQSLEVRCCDDLVDILGIDHLIGLKKLFLQINSECRVYNLLALTKLQVLTLYGMMGFMVNAKVFIPCQLRELCWNLSDSSKGLNLDGFNNLEELDLSYSNGLTSLATLGDLPALRVFNLDGCKNLLQLPDLSKSRNLEVLKLTGCYALVLGERDIEMLSELPLLQPLPFDEMCVGKDQSCRLDLRRGKVLVHRSFKGWNRSSWEVWKAGEWGERDLGPPPIRIGKLGPFDEEFQDRGLPQT